jgi:hypothetical protein
MLVKIGQRKVDVVDPACAKRECFVLGFDKGSFTPGRGYTSYHQDAKGNRVEKPVCSTRHHRGCPSNSVCDTCRSASVDPPGGPCKRKACTGQLVDREGGGSAPPAPVS